MLVRVFISLDFSIFHLANACNKNFIKLKIIKDSFKNENNSVRQQNRTKIKNKECGHYTLKINKCRSYEYNYKNLISNFIKTIFNI